MDFLERLAGLAFMLFLTLVAVATGLLTLGGIATLSSFGFEIQLAAETASFFMAFVVSLYLLLK